MRADKGRQWKIINGKPRTEMTAKLTNDEYAAMAASIRSCRRKDGLSRKERRAEYVMRQKNALWVEDK